MCSLINVYNLSRYSFPKIWLGEGTISHHLLTNCMNFKSLYLTSTKFIAIFKIIWLLSLWIYWFFECFTKSSIPFAYYKFRLPTQFSLLQLLPLLCQLSSEQPVNLWKPESLLYPRPPMVLHFREKFEA